MNSYMPEGAYEALCQIQDAAAARDERLEDAREAWRTEILSKASAGEKYQPLSPFGKHRSPVDPVAEMAYHMYEQAMDHNNYMHKALRAFCQTLQLTGELAVERRKLANTLFGSAACEALNAEVKFNAENEVDAA